MFQNNPHINSSLKYLEKGGEMSKLTREFNWENTSIGSPDTWPQSLLTTLSILLNSKFPMFLWWGPELLQFYNDAYRPSLGVAGKHPKALGQRGQDCWKEIWPVIKPLIDTVLEKGESTWSEDQLIPILRNNRLEDVYWTFSYSPVIDEHGKVEGILVICNETTDKVKTYLDVIEANKELEFAIEAAELGTWDLNPVTNRFIGNNRLKDWFGLPHSNEIDLKKATDVIIEQDRERVNTAILASMKNELDGNYDIIYTIVNPNTDVKRIVKAKGKAMFDENGKAYRFSGILQDVTEEHVIQVRKDEFISVASHELKTPLTSLSASMQILQKLITTEPVSENVKRFIDKAGKNLNKLRHLFDDLLNVTKIQEGQLALNKTRFDLAALVKDSCEHISNVSNHELVLNACDSVMVYADYRRIDQVLVNFINNAIKYSPQSNKIEVTVEHNGKDAKVLVRDFGIGISLEKLPHLFDRYYRVDSLGHQFSGLGLGLYISADIIRRHDSEIHVESVRGEGSKFWFTLPVD